MGACDRPDDPAQRDLAWVGYHPRAAIPYFVLAFLLTALVQIARWYDVDISQLAAGKRALVIFASAWAVWPAVIAVFLYRTITYTYRLTDRALLADFGMFSNKVPAVPLAEVVSVTVGNTWLSRRLGIGRVEVRTKGGSLVLPGVRRPEGFASLILAAAENHAHRNGRGRPGS